MHDVATTTTHLSFTMRSGGHSCPYCPVLFVPSAPSSSAPNLQLVFFFFSTLFLVLILYYILYCFVRSIFHHYICVSKQYCVVISVSKLLLITPLRIKSDKFERKYCQDLNYFGFAWRQTLQTALLKQFHQMLKNLKSRWTDKPLA